MKSSKLPVVIACVIGWAIPTISKAHYLWIALNPDTGSAALGLQENPGQEPLSLEARASSVKAWTCAGKAIRLRTDSNWLRASTDSPCVGASLDYGVIDRKDAGRGVFWLRYYAKGATTFAASQENLRLPMELSATERSDGTPVVTVLRDGKPAVDAEVVVEGPDGTAIFDGKTGADGTAVLPQPQAGPVQVRALITDNQAGTHDGKPYELARTYSTLTIQCADQKPLSRLLRESYGNMHDIASSSAFINTVMAKKLTLPQLIDHLQQRAIINEACDRILRRTHSDLLPYGSAQRQVLGLLRDNLHRIGAPWPAESKAWPETQALLKEIEESAQRGPYFALGVFHVYYGGVTHGGRDIGAMIDQQLKTDLTYYEKSDGYEPYALRVDEIIDPKAQQQMIHGADEAYRYVIGVNNLPVFKAATMLP